MRHLAIYIFGLFILSSCGQVVHNDDGTTSYKYYYTNGNLKKEKFIKRDSAGKEIEYWRFYYENGTLKKEGVEKTGSWIFYSQDGQKESETNFVNDIRHGHAIYFWPNGHKKLEGEYINGKQNGLWTEYKEDGDTLSILEYKDGELKLF
jgi:antitoxin component YwqK of YwqJK toxin-antitoxin module